MNLPHDQLSIEQQRALHRLCWRFEDRVMSDQPPPPGEWLAERGDLPALLVISEFLAIREEAPGKPSPQSQTNSQAGMWFEVWQQECLAELPDQRAAVSQLFGDFTARMENARSRNSPSRADFDARLAGDRYRFLEEIARGGTGAIWRVYDSNLRREVAVKTLLGDRSNRDSLVSDFSVAPVHRPEFDK